MPEFRRYFVPGATYFFTVVTDGRVPFLCQPEARALLRKKVDAGRERWTFKIEAFVLLPDHLHTIWTLPPGDADYSKRWGWIKKEFTKDWLAGGQAEQPTSAARERDGRRGVWQPRFWEHLIRDEDDFDRHADYIHYNPVKHGHASTPGEWEWSTFHEWVRNGYYPAGWGGGDTESRFTPIRDTVGE